MKALLHILLCVLAFTAVSCRSTGDEEISTLESTTPKKIGLKLFVKFKDVDIPTKSIAGVLKPFEVDTSTIFKSASQPGLFILMLTSKQSESDTLKVLKQNKAVEKVWLDSRFDPNRPAGGVGN